MNEIRAALKGRTEHTVKLIPGTCDLTGLNIVSWIITGENFSAGGSMSEQGYDNWLRYGGTGMDTPMIAAMAKIGLAYDGMGGEATLMQGWTWEQHDRAKALIAA